jgi:hypothetical protein
VAGHQASGRRGRHRCGNRTDGTTGGLVDWFRAPAGTERRHGRHRCCPTRSGRNGVVLHSGSPRVEGQSIRSFARSVGANVQCTWLHRKAKHTRSQRMPHASPHGQPRSKMLSRILPAPEGMTTVCAMYDGPEGPPLWLQAAPRLCLGARHGARHGGCVRLHVLAGHIRIPWSRGSVAGVRPARE